MAQIDIKQQFKKSYKDAYNGVGKIMTMRQSQVRYFINKGKDNLIKAKEAEKAVDDFINSFPDNINEIDLENIQDVHPAYVKAFKMMFIVISAARSMRSNQKEYFSYRGKKELKKAKDSEKHLDDLLRDLIDYIYKVLVEKGRNGLSK